MGAEAGIQEIVEVSAGFEHSQNIAIAISSGWFFRCLASRVHDSGKALQIATIQLVESRENFLQGDLRSRGNGERVDAHPEGLGDGLDSRKGRLLLVRS